MSLTTSQLATKRTLVNSSSEAPSLAELIGATTVDPQGYLPSSNCTERQTN